MTRYSFDYICISCIVMASLFYIVCDLNYCFLQLLQVSLKKYIHCQYAQPVTKYKFIFSQSCANAITTPIWSCVNTITQVSNENQRFQIRVGSSW